MLPPCLNALERSHLRHAEVVHGLVAAARRLVGPTAGEKEPTEAEENEALGVVEDALAYFHRSVPRHFLDEEQSLFPRLALRVPAHAAALAALIAEHPFHLALHRRIEDAMKVIEQRYSPHALDELLDAALELERAYADHARREDVLFEEAARALTEEDLRGIDDEMEKRRGRGGGGGGGGRGGGGGGRGGGGGGGGGGRR